MPCVDLKGRKKKYSVQVFKAFVDGYDRLILCSPLVAVGFFVLVSSVFKITFHLLSDRVLATECSVALLFKGNVCFFVKALKTLGNQYCNGLKTPQVQSVYIF